MHAFVGEPFSLSSTKLCMETKYSPFHSLEKLQSAARLTFFPCIFNYSCLHADSLVLSRLYRTIPYTWSRRYHLDYHALVTKWDSTTIPGAFSMVPFVWWLPLPFAWCPLPFDEAPFKLGLSPCLLDAVVCEECLIAKAAFSKLLPLPFWGAPTKVLPLLPQHLEIMTSLWNQSYQKWCYTRKKLTVSVRVHSSWMGDRVGVLE